MSRKRRHKNRHAERAGAEKEEKVALADDAAEITDEDSGRDHEPSADATPTPPEDEESGLDPVDSEPDSGSDEELERLAAEARDMRALAQRKQAEFENYRKRTERERAETTKYAAAEVLKEMLPVLDNLERAVEAAKSTEQDEGQLQEGVEIILKQFRDTLFKLGLSEVEAKAALFDPHVHEAIGRVESDEHPEGTVVEVLQKGYLFQDRLLRPSMVSVSLPPGGESSNEDQQNEDEAVRQGE